MAPIPPELDTHRAPAALGERLGLNWRLLMPQSDTTLDQWLVFTLAEQKYALHVDCVRELIKTSDHKIRSIPQTPDDIVGAICTRGSVIAVRDLRTMINLPSLAKETADVTGILEQHKIDHADWFHKLSSTIHEGGDPSLACGSQSCTFRKWYDALMGDKTALQTLTNSNFTLFRLFGQLGPAHDAIHSIAAKVADLVREKKFDMARALMDETGAAQLQNLIGITNQIEVLLDELRKPLIIIMEWEKRQLGIQVDSVNSVVRIPDEKISPLPERVEQSGLFKAIAKTDNDGSGLMLLIDGAKLFEDADPNWQPPDLSQFDDNAPEFSKNQMAATGP